MTRDVVLFAGVPMGLGRGAALKRSWDPSGEHFGESSMVTEVTKQKDDVPLFFPLRWNELKDDTIYQPLRSGRIWHKVSFFFKRSLTGLNLEFSFS